MKQLLYLFLFIFGYSAAAQDVFPTKDGKITIYPINHASLAIEWNNLWIYVDPYGGKEMFEGLAAPDIILITDIHQDHLDLATLGLLDYNNTTFIVPRAVYDKLPAQFQEKSTVLANGDETEVKRVGIRAIPMYNLPETVDSRHPKGRGNGYVLELGDKRTYISGDTEGIPEMRNLHDIDIAFVCMNLPYTMDVDQAADAVLAFGPKVVYPYHYRGKDGLSDVERFKQLVSTGNPNIEVRLRDWYKKP